MKSTILFVLVSFIFTEIAFGQIELNSSGNVGIGSITPDSDYKLSISYGTGLSGDDIRAIYAVYTGSSHEGSAIEGRATSSTSNGIGGDFLGGYIGVRGRANEAQGSGPRRGVHGEASRGQYNLGVYGKANSTTSNTLTNYGVYGIAQGGVSGSSNYGIFGTTSGAGTIYAGYFNGNVTVTGDFHNPSDEKLKDNIASLDGASVLEKLMQLRPTSYTYKQTGDYEAMNLSEGPQYGLIAQEVEAIFPEFVSDNVHPASLDEAGNETGKSVSFKGMNYNALIPLLLKAIQEQQAEIDALKSTLNANGIQVNR